MGPYTTLGAREQQLWRHKMYRALLNDWMDAVKDGRFEGGLCEYAYMTLQEFEYLEKYEACKGLLLTIDEYADELRC